MPFLMPFFTQPRVAAVYAFPVNPIFDSGGEASMEIHNLDSLDSDIMYGIVNEKLRLECASLDDLASRFDLDLQAFQAKIDAMGCYYDPITNQLRQK